MLLPSCITSNAVLISANGYSNVMNSSILSSPDLYLSHNPGSSVRPLVPPNAEPRQLRPVTNWNGRVEISSPAAATPIMTLVPQPLWHASRAARYIDIPIHRSPLNPSLTRSLVCQPGMCATDIPWYGCCQWPRMCSQDLHQSCQLALAGLASRDPLG
jgi:hypothetical protein